MSFSRVKCLVDKMHKFLVLKITGVRDIARMAIVYFQFLWRNDHCCLFRRCVLLQKYFRRIQAGLNIKLECMPGLQ